MNATSTALTTPTQGGRSQTQTLRPSRSIPRRSSRRLKRAASRSLIEAISVLLSSVYRGMTYEYGRDRADHRRRRIEAAVATILAGSADGALPLLGPGVRRRAGGRAHRPRERRRPASSGRSAHRGGWLARRARSVQVVGLCRARGRPDRL